MCRHPWSYLEIKFGDIGNMLNYSLDWGRRPHPSSSGTIRWLKLESISCHIVFAASLIIGCVLTSSRRENARIPSSVGYVIDCWIRPHSGVFFLYFRKLTFLNGTPIAEIHDMRTWTIHDQTETPNVYAVVVCTISKMKVDYTIVIHHIPDIFNWIMNKPRYNTDWPIHMHDHAYIILIWWSKTAYERVFSP